MKKLLLLILSITISLCSMAQDDSFTEVAEFGSEEVVEKEQQDFLGFMLLPGSSGLVRFYEVHKNSNGTFKYTQLTVDSFWRRACGKERSAANPTGKSLFFSYGFSEKLGPTQVSPDSIRGKNGTIAIGSPRIYSYKADSIGRRAIDLLWKLRYKEYPYETAPRPPEQGWGNNEQNPELPSEEQFAILSKYGITRISDLCYGDWAFLLLKDLTDDKWITKYKGSSISNPNSVLAEDGEVSIENQ